MPLNGFWRFYLTMILCGHKIINAEKTGAAISCTCFYLLRVCLARGPHYVGVGPVGVGYVGEGRAIDIAISLRFRFHSKLSRFARNEPPNAKAGFNMLIRRAILTIPLVSQAESLPCGAGRGFPCQKIIQRPRADILNGCFEVIENDF